MNISKDIISKIIRRKKNNNIFKTQYGDICFGNDYKVSFFLYTNFCDFDKKGGFGKKVCFLNFFSLY